MYTTRDHDLLADTRWTHDIADEHEANVLEGLSSQESADYLAERERVCRATIITAVRRWSKR